MNDISRLANNKTYRENAGRSDIDAIGSNLAYVPRSYANTLTGLFESIPEIFKDTVQGAFDQLQQQNPNGNWWDQFLGVIRGATFGAETGMQEGLVHQMTKVLRGN